ncbi:hypothetical protein [uncultured Thiocystis sp.]|uniref:hypothetical protein n=1 Tax=uncultured Thiocystis sp. TaxID=1202134 RepID=UPI0025EC3241|nr:hypothetical protein [uncultured Thiocystis sp.]
MASVRPGTVIANHTGRLILTPEDPNASPDGAALIAALARAELIGEQLEGWSDRLGAGPSGAAYRVGAAFLSLVSFTGCAVKIATAPDPRAPFCHLRFPPLAPHPQLYAGRNTRPPRCRDCRGRLEDWRERAARWASQPELYVTCPSCGATRLPWQWDWKEQGGFGRRAILVEEVFPGEAMPTDALLDLLRAASGTGWRHFYVRDSLL